MQLKEIMTREINGIRPDASLSDAIEKLRHLGGEPLPVYDGDRLVGMLTEHDIIEWTSRGGRDSRLAQVRDVMEREVLYCYEDQDVEDAARLVSEKRRQGLLVMKRNGDRGQNQQPVGTVSLADLAAPRTRESAPRISEADHERSHDEFTDTRIFLQPIASPAILGLFGFAGATFMVGANWANWFAGNTALLFPFVAFFGGLAQFLAGMWAFKARDGLGTAMHGTIGSFWMAFGLLHYLFATGTLTQPSPIFSELGYGLIVLAAITLVGCVASLAQNVVSACVWLVFAGASGLGAYAYISGDRSFIPYAGGLLVASAILAWYNASAILFESSFRRPILPTGRPTKEANIPKKPVNPIGYDYGEPGVKMGSY